MIRGAVTFAKTLRRHSTDAESLLWRHLRGHRFAGWKFKRQQPLGPYIVDFVCFAARVVVEVDGGQHLESEADAARDAWLGQQGFKVLRFWNSDVLLKTEIVLEHLVEHLPLSPGPSPTRGEGRHTEPRP
jgi:very-short-patch-repair endonuclease